jgi:hypothetical protein
LISAYHLLSRNKLSPDQQKAPTQQIDEIIIWEPFSTLLFGTPPSAFIAKHREDIASMSREEMFHHSMKQVTGYYQYPPSLYSFVKASIPVTDTVFEAYNCLSDDDYSFMAAMVEGQILDPSQLQYYLTSGEVNRDEGMENLRSALKEMVGSEGVQKIKLLTTKNPVPTCLEGIAILVGS